MFAPGQALLAPVRIFGGHDSLDGAQPIVEAAGRFMQLVEQFSSPEVRVAAVFHLVM